VPLKRLPALEEMVTPAVTTLSPVARAYPSRARVHRRQHRASTGVVSVRFYQPRQSLKQAADRLSHLSFPQSPVA